MDLETKEYIKTLDLDTLARWMCLIEGIDYIFEKLEEDDKCDDYLFRSKKSFNVLERSLVKYIDERFEAMRSDIIIDCSIKSEVRR
jgi:hypothetical protein